MRRAELRLETYLAESRGTWVTMREIKRACRFDWDEARHIWRTAVPRLAASGLLRERTRNDRTSREFCPTPQLVAGVADLQWRCAPGIAAPAAVG
jgi:hypothetical protein